jgi:hypothetical protein
MGLLWINGKGGGLMNGWNSMDKEKKALYDERAFLRFNGLMMLTAAAVWAVSAFIIYLGHFWGMTISVLAVIPIAAGNIYSLRSNRFRKKDADGKVLKPDPITTDPKKARERKAKVIMGVFFGVVVTGLVAWLLISGSGPIFVDVASDSLTIRGQYGTTINFSDISDIELVESSMTAIGVGRRTNGMATPSVLRGHFSRGDVRMLLFIQQQQEGPTIRISRINAGPVYISTSDAAETRAIHNNIMQAWSQQP